MDSTPSALTYNISINDPLTRFISLVGLGTYNSGPVTWHESGWLIHREVPMNWALL